MERIKVESLDHLKKLCEDGEIHDFVLMLNYGLRSSKSVIYSKNDNPPWWIFNFIDDSEMELTDEELMQETNIGVGIERGAFLMEAY